jgi:hypothetical protein
MRCIACDKTLNDYESTRRHAMTNEFLDMCNRCMKDMPNIPTKDRPDLVKEADFDDEMEDALDTLGNDLDLETVTTGYNSGLDKD